MAAGNVVTIPVWSESDGTGAPAKDKARIRNDAHYQERLAELWMKEQHQHQSGVTYNLNQLPYGYSGWEKRRGDTKHVDRCTVDSLTTTDLPSLTTPRRFMWTPLG